MCNTLKSVFDSYLINYILLDMKMYYGPPIIWLLHTFCVVAQPCRFNGSLDRHVSSSLKKVGAKKGRGHFSNFGVCEKCVTNQILFLVLHLLES